MDTRRWVRCHATWKHTSLTYFDPEPLRCRFGAPLCVCQLSAIIECADAAHGLNGLVVGDGGCTCPGDVAKVSFE